MSSEPVFIDELRQAISRPRGGVIGFVETLLTLCRDYDLQIEWHRESLRVRSHRQNWHELATTFPRRSAFRTVLARIASQTRARDLRSISPYGGEGFAIVGTSATLAIISVKFTNTIEEQSLFLEAPGPSRAMPVSANENWDWDALCTLLPAEARSDFAWGATYNPAASY